MAATATDPRTNGRPIDERSKSTGGGDPTGSAGGSPRGGEHRAPRGIDRLYRYLDRLCDTSFFGKVVVSFQNGKVCDIKVEQTKKLEEL